VGCPSPVLIFVFSPILRVRYGSLRFPSGDERLKY
jgi:hypothetical protein